ncbi:thioredoxin-dependent thiol peroxidase [Croceimicrobium hydrocarbonivorans]|uniref:thioredoxin-dependent peroxiredoxin n=1 Tax=Croceimicrobium hydrocarbonivorans TaxID=2761580 RepID=A0A7H0VI37_9FLAO|nr:thioredoxin-dependent thiol peroxidase [Croceimicrobium hydrocarbonivorans]QNR25385.1 thioredoxin-dependent thiol peroxidase [Croceimicrobium hydrocarbonivorans]
MTHLKEGDKAPDINAEDQNGNPIKLSDFKGKKVVLYFYPKDDTPGCTAEACNFRDNYQDLKDKGFELIGVSADTAAKHQKFATKYDLPFALIPDTEKEVIEAYGVWGLKKFMGREYDGIHRETFVIDEEGKIAKIYLKVKTKEATEQILADFS